MIRKPIYKPKNCMHPFAFRTLFGKFCPTCNKNIQRINKVEDTIMNKKSRLL